jgi:hypothetical protein
MDEDEDAFFAPAALAEAFADAGELEWTREDVIRVMTRLADAHWYDCGEEYGGFATAMHGLSIAVIADQPHLDEDERMRGVLHHIGWMAGLLHGYVEDEATNRALSTIEGATKQWQWLDCYGAMKPATIPGVNDAASPAVH